MTVIVSFLTFILAVSVYFIPTVVAIARRHVNALAIFLTNLYLGWTLIGWFAAVIWAAAVISAPAAGEAVPVTGKKKNYIIYALSGAGALLALGLIVAVFSRFSMTAPPPFGSDAVVSERKLTSGIPAPSTVRQGVPLSADEIFGE